MPKHTVYSHIARLYDLLDLPFEYFRYRRLRKIIWQDISGRILDAGVGTGRNMTYYPKDAEMTGIDLSPHMLKRARMRRNHHNVEVDLQEIGRVCDLFRRWTF